MDGFTAQQLADTVAAMNVGILNGLMHDIYHIPGGPEIHQRSGFNPCAYRMGQLVGEFLPNDGERVMWFDQYGNMEAGAMHYDGLFDHFDPPMHKIFTAEDIIGWLPIPEEQEELYETVQSESQGEETSEESTGLCFLDTNNGGRE